MEIYVVQKDDTVESIANKYGIQVERLIYDNGLIHPCSLVVGQALIILNPKTTYIVQDGDDLEKIAESNGISELQLIRNNPFLYDREYIYPGETLVISYNTLRDVQVNGYTTASISQDVLLRSLPYLTFISIYNYHVSDHDSSGISSLGDDTYIIKTAKQYSTIPLLMISALSPTGAIDVEYVYRLLLDIKLQDKLIDELLLLLRSKEFMGVNLLISFLSDYNQRLYQTFFAKLSEVFKSNGYYFMITISPDYFDYENLEYHSLGLLVDRIIFLQNIWVKQKLPPAPISNVSFLRPFIEAVVSQVSPEAVSLGKPLLGYDWIIPFIPGSAAKLMSLNSTLLLAYEQQVVITLDEESQTPYFYYNRASLDTSDEHKVWFIDAHSLKALDDIILEYNLSGTGIWNITSYNQQLFSITNATFNIIKLSM